ncbi:GNAT family N-acetyltransferase [Pseudoalteromonas sp. MMG010]|uniref:GNAT family N-acetyltransferase n=1 Tax=Pseudoalteromonas sp. MMG010 TaxID=2822685 RepID=UPI001B39D387|nr:GNAT family N-acetyltransferase [Pseudoalteromonas sp. MMG010]MBQ4832864.1 GNAT family N-acetyltransferase [Pseudoalteromonas sp. MMG010]
MDVSITCLAQVKIPLVNKFYANYSVRGRAKKHDDVWVVYHNFEIVAACRIQNKSDFLFLSTVFVAPDYRLQGLAKKLLSSVLLHYSDVIYTFAYTPLIHFYTELGFNQVLTYTPALNALFNIYSHRDIRALQFK